MASITDDCGDETELDTILYDGSIGKCVRLERDGDELIEINVITGDTIDTIAVAEFKEECMAYDFDPVPEYVTETPEKIIEEVMHAVLRGERDAYAGYSSWEVDVAWRLCSIETIEPK